MDSEQDQKLKSILAELNDEGENTETFNRKYFDNNDSTTPSNTPSAKKNAEFSLKNVDFSKYLENQNQYDSYASSHFRQALSFCDVPYVGNCKYELGYSPSKDKPKICGALLCTKCDIKVLMFKNMKWCETCDYLFFRNNYGDQIKLSDKLLPSPNNTCYSCQCTWVNIEDDLVEAEKLPNVNWTCGGHHAG